MKLTSRAFHLVWGGSVTLHRFLIRRTSRLRKRKLAFPSVFKSPRQALTGCRRAITSSRLSLRAAIASQLLVAFICTLRGCGTTNPRRCCLMALLCSFRADVTVSRHLARHNVLYVALSRHRRACPVLRRKHKCRPFADVDVTDALGHAVVARTRLAVIPWSK